MQTNKQKKKNSHKCNTIHHKVGHKCNKDRICVKSLVTNVACERKCKVETTENILSVFDRRLSQT